MPRLPHLSGDILSKNSLPPAEPLSFQSRRASMDSLSEECQAALHSHRRLRPICSRRECSLASVERFQCTELTPRDSLGLINLSGISWVIVGGESGPGARPMKKEWVVSIRDQCHQQRVPFFFKQWGGFCKKMAGRLLDGRTYDEYPKRSSVEVPDRSKCEAFAKALAQLVNLPPEQRLDGTALLG